MRYRDLLRFEGTGSIVLGLALAALAFPGWLVARRHGFGTPELGAIGGREPAVGLDAAPAIRATAECRPDPRRGRAGSLQRR